MRPQKFRALVTIDPAAGQDWDRDSPTRHLAVRAHRHDPERIRSFNAMLRTDDEESLRPGDTHHMVTTVADDEAKDFLTPGEHFELLTGRHELGHGVVSRRVVV